MSLPRLFSGMQPSADSLHIGNYIGALTQWRTLQTEYQSIYCVVDLHALTLPQEPAVLRQAIRRTAAQYIAAGVDPTSTILFAQSQVAAHTQLAWVLTTMTGFGEASRMTQYKDRVARFGQESLGVGVFTYPMLMAADILLYDAAIVPVGEDQRQHIELTRDLAQRFNSRYGDTFVVPEARIVGETAKIYDLQNPTAKMSKSAESPAGIIWLLDEPAVTAKKLKSAVTDGERVIRFDPAAKPGVSNLLTILSVTTGSSVESLVDSFAGRGYGDLKTAVADAVVAEFAPVRQRALELLDDPAELDRVLDANAERAVAIARPKLAEVYEKVGLAAPLA